MTSVNLVEKPHTEAAAGAVPVALVPFETSELTTRICRAFLTCVAATGLRATSVDDVAIEAGCARATIYRVIPGGRTGLLIAAVDHGLAAIIGACIDAAAGAPDLHDAVAVSISTATSMLAESSALQRLLIEEPGAILPFLSFDGLNPVLDRVALWSPLLFGRFVSETQAREAADWVARVVLAQLRTPGGPLDLTDPAHCRRLVATFFCITPESELSRI